MALMIISLIVVLTCVTVKPDFIDDNNMPWIHSSPLSEAILRYPPKNQPTDNTQKNIRVEPLDDFNNGHQIFGNDITRQEKPFIHSDPNKKSIHIHFPKDQIYPFGNNEKDYYGQQYSQTKTSKTQHKNIYNNNAVVNQLTSTASDSKLTKEDIDNSAAILKPCNLQHLYDEDDGLNVKAKRCNALEMEEDYDDRDSDWDQSDYDNDYWVNTNDIDDRKHYGFHHKLRDPTYVGDHYAAEQINPQANFIPNKYRNTQHEKLTIPQRNYHRDINVNNIYRPRYARINPDAEYIRHSPKFTGPIYDHEIDEDYKNPVHLSRDIKKKYISSARVKPNAKKIDYTYKRDHDKNRGDYFGDTRENKIFKNYGARRNHNAETFNRKQHGQYRGDTHVNKILKDRRMPMNQDAELFTPDEDDVAFVRFKRHH